jgi:D-3-phosphoglycerate dehydrogenase
MIMPTKVVTREGLALNLAKEMLSKVGAQLIFAPLWSEDDIVKHAADADAVIVGSTEPYTQKAIRAMTQCQIISRYGIGHSNIDVEEATRQGIPVTVVADASMHEVSDYALAFILAFSRRLFPLVQAVRAGGWKPGLVEIVKARGKMFRLNQQVLGLVGMGRIGALVAQKARAFGLKVLVYDPYVSPEAAQKAGVERVDFERILKESDYISLHAPLTPETNKLFGLKEFRKMKPTGYIINAARGALIDEQALCQAITEGLIAGAGLDVTDPEPPAPDNPLLKLDRVLLTGHSSWFSESSTQELQQRAAENVLSVLEGKWPSSLVNPEVKEQKNRRIK